MNCTETRQAINQLPRQAAPQGAVAEHLSDCELCQYYYSDLLLEQELAELQVPEPSAAFLEGALRRAVVEPVQSAPAKRSNWRWPSAVAASVLAAVVGVFTLWDSVSVNESFPEAELASLQRDFHKDMYFDDVYREDVRIVIYSKEDQDSAEISIELAENLELEGYAGKHQVAWNTKLSKGKNLLTLPVLVRNHGGQVHVSSRFGDSSHEVRVQVARRDESAQSGMDGREHDPGVFDFTG